MRVLLAEDDRDQLTIRQMLLKQAGFDPIGASDYASAIASAEKKQPDCAVVDLRLPDERSGVRLIRELKALNGKMRIVVLTGATSKRFEKSPERQLVDAVIEKGEPSSNLIRQLKTFRKSR